MLGFVLGVFRLVWLFGKGHPALLRENLALRQQLSIYRRNQKRPRLIGRDRWFWISLSAVWKVCLSEFPKYLSGHELYFLSKSSFDANFPRHSHPCSAVVRPFSIGTPT